MDGCTIISPSGVVEPSKDVLNKFPTVPKLPIVTSKKQCYSPTFHIGIGLIGSGLALMLSLFLLAFLRRATGSTEAPQFRMGEPYTSNDRYLATTRRST